MKRSTAITALTLAGAALLVALAVHDGAGTRRTARGGSSLIGPIAGAAASVQWVRAHHELLAGRDARGFALAEGALALDPGATVGWTLLVDHQLRTLASHLREPDPDRRRAWVESALRTAERGRATARDPAHLALGTGVGLWLLSEADEVPDWPGGRDGLRTEAAAWFERARTLGSDAAADFLELLATEPPWSPADGTTSEGDAKGGEATSPAGP